MHLLNRHSTPRLKDKRAPGPGETASSRQSRLRLQTTIWMGALGGWLAVWIATPLILWTAGDHTFPLLATLGVLAQSAATMSALALRWPSHRLVGSLLLVVAITWAVEFAGISLGIPFGSYTYSPALQPQIGGVPLVIPLAWFMMLGPAWGVTASIIDRFRSRFGRFYRVGFAGLSGLVFTAWDLYLDPLMVSRGLWTWQNPSGYFGIPLENFAGWWVSAFLLTFLLQPAGLPRRPLSLIYTLTWLFQGIGSGIFWGQPGPAAAGFIGMGVFAIWGWLSGRRSP